MLVWINSIIQTLTTTNIISSKTAATPPTTTTPSFTNSIELKISPLCSRCIEKTLGDVWFTHIDDRRIRVIEGVEDYFSELISQPNQQLQAEDESTNNNSKIGSRACSSEEHFLTRKEILFGVPSPINHSKYYQQLMHSFHFPNIHH